MRRKVCDTVSHLRSARRVPTYLEEEPKKASDGLPPCATVVEIRGTLDGSLSTQVDMSHAPNYIFDSFLLVYVVTNLIDRFSRLQVSET
jgi:hypothetical protein